MNPRYCTECGTELEPATKFCTGCGRPLMATTAVDPTPPVPAPVPASRRPWVAAVALGLAILAVAIGAMFARGRQTAPVVAASPTGPTAAASTQEPDSPPPPTEPVWAQTPGQAMQLSQGQARTQLREHRQDDRYDLGALAYEWSPQVSSKCEGLDNVDLGPGWFANGSPETDNLRAQHILAFHVALANRDGALLVTDRDVGVRTIYSGCGGNTMWMAIVPKSFASATAANRWCDRNGYPLDECAARYVVPSGESGSEIVWRR